MPIAIALVAIFVVSIDSLMLPVLFPAIHADLSDTPETTLSWVFSAYTITVGALSVAAGRVGDRTGRRRVFIAGLALWAVAAFGAALAPSGYVLIAARVAQGTAHAMLTPSSIGLLLGMTHQRDHTRMLALWVGTGSAGGVMAPTLGAVVEAGPGWRFAFLISASVAVAAFVPAVRALPDTERHADARIPDPVGSLTLATMMAAVTLAIYQGRRWGWFDLRIAAALAVVVVLAPLFWRRARTHPVPAVDPALFRFASFRRGMLVAGIISSALAANLFLLTQLNHDIYGYSVLRSGLALTPLALAATISSVLAPRIARRIGLGMVPVVGIAASVVGWAWMALCLDGSDRYLTVELPGQLLVGFGGWGMVLSSLNALSMAELPAADYGTGSAVLSTMRQVSNGLGIAFVFGFVATHLDVDRYRSAFLAMAVLGVIAATVADRVRRTTARELATMAG